MVDTPVPAPAPSPAPIPPPAAHPLLTWQVPTWVKAMVVLVAVLLPLVIIALIVMLFKSTDGYFSRAHWAGFYIGVGLCAGVLYWLFTPGATGELHIKEFGARMGGGAAIGGIFMLIAHWLTPAAEPSTLQLVSVDVPDATTIYLDGKGAGIRNLIRLGSDNPRILVEFEATAGSGEFFVKYLKGDGSIYRKRYDVTRAGHITEQPETKVGSP